MEVELRGLKQADPCPMQRLTPAAAVQAVVKMQIRQRVVAATVAPVLLYSDFLERM
jgi:hypothetical protein